MKLKYIRTFEDEIIIFPESIPHNRFYGFGPISAGFIDIGTNLCGNIIIQCFGESESLKLKSIPNEDSALAEKQFIHKY